MMKEKEEEEEEEQEEEGRRRFKSLPESPAQRDLIWQIYNTAFPPPPSLSLFLFSS